MCVGTCAPMRMDMYRLYTHRLKERSEKLRASEHVMIGNWYGQGVGEKQEREKQRFRKHREAPAASLILKKIEQCFVLVCFPCNSQVPVVA